jgi:hypothetical protein
VDQTAFDALVQRVARQTTRRAVLATLLGGALLLRAPAASEATKEAQRRKDRRRKQRRRKGRGRKGATDLLRPIAMIVDNTGGPRSVTVELGDWPNRQCCRAFPAVTVPVGTSQRFAASFAEAYLWIDGEYWINFQNPALAPPNVSAAFRGQASTAPCCKRVGRTEVNRHDLLVGRPKPFTLAFRTFLVTRTRDTNYKNFTVALR